MAYGNERERGGGRVNRMPPTPLPTATNPHGPGNTGSEPRPMNPSTGPNSNASPSAQGLAHGRAFQPGFWENKQGKHKGAPNKKAVAAMKAQGFAHPRAKAKAALAAATSALAGGAKTRNPFKKPKRSIEPPTPATS